MSLQNLPLLQHVAQEFFGTTLDWQVREDGKISADTQNSHELAARVYEAYNIPKGSTGVYVGETNIAFDQALLQNIKNIERARDPEGLKQIFAEHQVETKDTSKSTISKELHEALRHLNLGATALDTSSFAAPLTANAKQKDTAIAVAA
jgi:hypothetical protein